MPWAFLLVPALVYQLLAIAAALNHLRRRQQRAAERQWPVDVRPGVSVLKPLRGLDPNTASAFASQLAQNYEKFEVLFGVADADDPAADEVRRLVGEHGADRIRLIVGRDNLPNGKVGVLANLARHARYEIWVVNDSDIKVTPDYLSRAVGPLRDPTVGLVTCLYRVRAHSAPALWEGLGIAADFMPSTLVAQLIGVREFGLGSTLAFRAADFERAGGFPSIGAYLADDYQLAKRITGGGGRALLSTYTVETALGEATWRGGWQHQLRWARTIRSSNGKGFAGLPITHAGLWALLGLAMGAKTAVVVLLAVRIVAALLGSGAVLGSASAAALCWLAPVWDVYAFAVWIASYGGREVRWRDRVLKVDAEGRIL